MPKQFLLDFMKNNSFIDENLYREIVRGMPIFCVDVVITNNNKFLLGLRKNKPAKGQWYVIGGRVFKNEKLKEAVARKVEEEAGLIIKSIRFLTISENFFKESAFGVPTHTVNGVFVAETSSSAFRLPKYSDLSELKWFTSVDKNMPSYVKEMVKLAYFG